jgi:hypothetical protein
MLSATVPTSTNGARLRANAPDGARFDEKTATSRIAGALEGNFRGGDAVGTLHDMRFVFLDNDTKLLFATAYDGDWDAYIDDFVTIQRASRR